MNPSNAKYIYSRERRQFGRQCQFKDKNEMLASIPSRHELMEDYILRNPVDTGTQFSTQIAASEAQIDVVDYTSRGMCHTEGGWPKDIDYNDEEQKQRYRKKIERDESWGKKMLALAKPAEEAVLQNSAVNIYEKYFEENDLETSVKPIGNYKGNIVRVFNDQQDPIRPVIAFTSCPRNENKIIAAYAHKDFSPTIECSNDCYVWDIEQPNKPLQTLNSSDPTFSIEWNKRDDHIIAGGFRSGLVGTWDARECGEPNAISVMETSHRERVTSLRWISSKTHTEFFSCSSDGSVFWWDVRSLEEPTNKFYTDPQNEQRLSHAYGCTVLEYDFNLPMKFMVGTDFGQIFIGNRKASTPAEMLLAQFSAISGPIYALERNSFYFKYFLVVGGDSAEVWSEDSRDGGLFKTKNYFGALKCGAWSRTRPSLFFLGRNDGILEFFDIIMSHAEPIFTIKVADCPLTALHPTENGKKLLVGTKDGKIVLIQLEDGWFSNTNVEKTHLIGLFERETRKAKLLEARLKEIKLKTAKMEVSEKPSTSFSDIEEEIAEEKPKSGEIYALESASEVKELSEAEIEFHRIVQEEIMRRKAKNRPEIFTAFDDLELKGRVRFNEPDQDVPQDNDVD